jgi:hypothetical protein
METFLPCGDSIIYVTNRFKNCQALTLNAVDLSCYVLQAFRV